MPMPVAASELAPPAASEPMRIIFEFDATGNFRVNVDPKIPRPAIVNALECLKTSIVTQQLMAASPVVPRGRVLMPDGTPPPF